MGANARMKQAFLLTLQEVDDCGLRNIQDLEPGPFGTEAKIHVLVKVEKAFVKTVQTPRDVSAASRRI